MKLKVWHIPQVPGKAFEVLVDTIEEAVKILDVLADYDDFQYRNNIKPDYANVNGVMMWDNEENDWIDWYIEGEDFYFDEPREYLQFLKHER